MKKKLFNMSLWLIMVLFSINANAQADPVFTSINLGNNDVTVTNVGNAEVDVTNYWVCLGPGRYRQLSALPIVTGDYVLSAGESVTFDYPLIANEATEGGVGFFTSTSFGSTNPDVYLDYVQWGGPNQDRAQQAVNTGIWSSASEFVSLTCPPTINNDIITTGGVRGGNPVAWGDPDGGTISIDAAATMALGNPSTLVNEAENSATICLDNNVAAPVVVNHVTQATNLSYIYIITDDSPEETVLNITDSNQIDLSGVAPGVCKIWGWSYAGFGGASGALAIFEGAPLQDVRDADCSEVSEEFITVTRAVPEAGTINIDAAATMALGNPSTLVNEAENSATICLDNDVAAPVVVNRMGNETNLSFLYVITDDNDMILNITNTNEIDLSGVAPGVCRIWGWSYRGVPENGGIFIGSPLADLEAADCSDLSDNFVTVTRAVPEAGTINIDAAATMALGNPSTLVNEAENSATICLDNDVAAPVVVNRVGNETNLSFLYVITDDQDTILNITNTNEIDLSGVAPGVCRIWGWSYRGVPENGDIFIGSPLADLEAADCSDLSDNFVTVVRAVPEAGTINIDAAATMALGNPSTLVNEAENSATICLDNDVPAPVVVQRAGNEPNLSFLYVITDDQDTILNITNTNEIDLSGVAPGVCRIWGWSYRGVPENGGIFIGSPLADLEAADCSDLSDNFVTVVRAVPEAGTINIDAAATMALGNPSTLVNEAENSATICLDNDVAAPVVVNRVGNETNLSFLYVITDDNDMILNITNTNEIDLSGVAPGVCRIWGWSYRGVPENGGIFIGSPLADLEAADCSDLSDNFVTVVRAVPEAGTINIDATATMALGNPSTLVNEAENSATICLDNDVPAPVVVQRVGNEPNLSFLYVITDDQDTILNITNTNEIDLSGVAPGVCRIWGWSYRGVPENGGIFIGSPLADLEAADCSDLSDNFVTVVRAVPEAGTINVDAAATAALGNPSTLVNEAENSATICLDNDVPAPVVVQRAGNEPNLSFLYVITDDNDTILNITNTNEIDLSGVAPGVCRIWGWSYRGVPENGGIFIGSPLADLEAADCSDLSDNFVTVVRAVPEAGTINVDAAATAALGNTSTLVNEDTNSAVICIESGEASPVVVNRMGNETNLSFLYVITDDNDMILAIADTNEIDLAGAGLGVCRIWGWSYRGVPENGDIFIGSPLADLEAADCSDLSDNFVTVIREEANAGIIGIDVEATEALNTDTTLVIDGEFSVNICVDDTPDPIVVFHETPSENLTYNYVITDSTSPDETILAITASNEINLDPAGPGVCAIWGWSYRGLNNDDFIGMPLQALRDANCSDISEDSITVTRELVDAGTIGIDVEATEAAGGNTTSIDGEFEVSICVDGNPDPIVVFHETESNLSYLYVITDANTPDETILNITDSNSISLDGAGPGVCRIWGWSYRGQGGLEGALATFQGEPLQAMRDVNCSDVSEQFITVTREEADGGTVAVDVEATEAIGEDTTIVTGENSVTILVDDGVANPIVVTHENESPNLSYRYVITDAETGLILNVVNTNTIDLEGAGVGTCEIWGWSYRGVPGNGLDQVGQPLSALDDLDCSDISEDFIEVIRTDVLSVEDNQIDVELNMYPNPTTSFLNISLGGVNNGYAINVYSITGQVVMSETYTTQDNTLDVSRLSNGMYLLEVIDEASSTRTVKRFIKR